MNYKKNEIRVGLMVLISVGLLLVFLVLVFGVSFSEKTKTYRTYLQYVGGISKGSLVKFGGMDVGLVTDITLPGGEETRIGVTLEIDDRTPVRSNSLAFKTSVGLMSEYHIEISPGAPEASLLPAGSVLNSKEVLSFSQMAQPMGELSAQMQSLLDKVNDVFNDENRNHLASMVKSLNGMVETGGEHFVKLVNNLDALTENLANVSQDMNSLMDKNSENFEQTLIHLRKTTEDTSELIATMRESLAQFQGIMSTNGTSLVEIMENFQYASQNFEEFTRIVKERPWLLVRKDAPPVRKVSN